MYVYQITNKINNKKYIGITNNYKKRWGNECSYPKDKRRRQVIQEAIHCYGKDNFEFKVLFSNLSIEEAVDKEKQLIQENNSLVPNGYNVDPGGTFFPHSTPKKGEKNGRAILTDKEAQYILDNRDKPMYILYEEFNDKISYEHFKDIYHGKAFKHLSTTTSIYPYNREFSNQFTSGNKLEYDEVVKLRERYAKGEYWKDVYEDYKHIYPDEMTFWNVYYGNRYKLVMPEIFTKENRHYHSSLQHRGVLNPKAKLTEQDVLDIRKKHKEGISNSEIYKAYPQVTPTSIRAVINGKTWKHLL
jgi:group I intron endonuclease